MIKTIFNTCKEIPKNNTRNIVRASLKLQEEVGELSKEVNIFLKNLPEKEKGTDEIIGEVCDVIIASLDVLYLSNNNVSEDEVLLKIKEKLSKWTKNIN